jgi:predicted Ser/Thr protein kinase
VVDTTVVNEVPQNRIGKYVVERKLGEGGMGVVYLGRNKDLDSQIVIKTMRGDRAQDALLRRKFLEEGVKQAKLRHPNILTIHDSGIADDTLYLVMEFAPDGSLKERTDGDLDARQIVAIIKQIAAALDHAHNLAQPVIHLDIKPENILFVGDVPKLADFGIARVLSEGHSPTATLLAFSPPYAPPEQIEGRPEPKSDVYALGQMFFKMLGGSAWQKVTVITNADRRKIVDALPKHARKYASIIGDCLQAVPKQRPTAGELAERLAQLDKGGRVPRLVVLAALLVTLAAVVSNTAVRGWVSGAFERLFPGDTQHATFALTPADAQLWIDDRRVDGREVELANGPHVVAVAAKGYTGRIARIDVATARPQFDVELIENPNTADFEYLSFRQGYRMPPTDPAHERVMRTRWTDPVLANLVELEKPGTPPHLDDLRALVRAGDADAITTLYVAAQARPDLNTEGAQLANLEAIAEGGYALAGVVAAEHYLARMNDPDGARNPQNRAKVLSLLRKAANNGMRDTANNLLSALPPES